MTVKRSFFVLIITVLVIAGAILAQHKLNDIYWQSNVAEKNTIATEEQTAPEFYQDVKPIVDSRCVVCHGCYDAPCQLKMTSFESIDRGAHKDKVYNGTRLLEASLTHIAADAKTTKQWREQGFYPVLNTPNQDSDTNTQASVIHRMLQLKRTHPLPQGELLPDSFDLSLDRDQECSKSEEFDDFEKKRPLWGMPYGLPAMEEDQQAILDNWIKTGAPVNPAGLPPTINTKAIESWESFLNGGSLKQRLMSRYIYEHLFLANIYFSENFSTSAAKNGGLREFFKLVRSTTAPGKPIKHIISRRPFDDPGSDVFYRLQRVKSTILAKQHMPYAFNSQRQSRWTELFLNDDYSVNEFPSYAPELASNPFITFKQLPVNTRYQFMLDEAQFTIMGYIKGPVCRGQVALNVINDHFWVVFVNPSIEVKYDSGDFLAKEAKNLMLPAAKGSSTLLPLSSWLTYSHLEKKYVEAKTKRFNQIFGADNKLDLSLIWDGDGDNNNAALTVYRHFDSSSVIKGLSGDVPKTAWVIDYSLLERIHYLLVAGFDVYGNVGHQLLTRLYMDFLRMEGEYNFLKMLPENYATDQLSHWYRGEESEVKQYLEALNKKDSDVTGINYTTNNPKKEFFDLLKKSVGENVIAQDVINTRPQLAVEFPYQTALHRLSRVEGATLNQLPEQSIVKLTLNNGDIRLISLILNRAHTNVSHLFGEQDRLIPKEYTLSVVEGVVGTYPNVFYDVAEDELDEFVSLVAKLSSKQDYHALVSHFGVRRTDQQFWQFSDSIHTNYRRSKPIEAGYLDFNRLENR